MDDLLSQPSFIILFAALVSLGLWRFSAIFSTSRIESFPRVGPKPGAANNKRFLTASKQIIEDGYSKYKNGVYKLWTIDMDRFIISHEFMSDLNKLPRSAVRLTASERYMYTGAEVAEDNTLPYEVCAGSLTKNISSLAPASYDEILFALEKKLEAMPKDSDSYSIPIFASVVDLVTCATSRVFVGPDLCRNPEWLSTATGHTLAISKAGEELLTYPSIVRPIVFYFLKSYRQLESSASVARRLLLPEFEKRTKRGNEKGKYQDMLQWLVDTAKGRHAEPERLVKIMQLLNMAAIHTTSITATNTFLDLCARPECIDMIREEMLQVMKEDGGIKGSTLSKLKKLDSFMRESRRMNSMGFLTFQRRLTVPLTLSNGSTIPKNSYISMAYQPMYRDPSYYPSPLTFDPLRFYNLRKKEGEEEKHQFASVDAGEALWTFGKFACPGRHWAAAQIKLLVIVLLLEFDISYPEGQTERPESTIYGAKCMPSMTQKMVLKRRVK